MKTDSEEHILTYQTQKNITMSTTLNRVFFLLVQINCTTVRTSDIYSKKLILEQPH